MRKYTHEDFINKLYKTNEYFRNGSFKVIGEYNGDSKVILCENEFGICKPTPNNLYKNSNLNMNSALDKGQYFINKAIKKHGNKYDYTKVNYVNNETRVTIICNKHGEFNQTPHEHLDGSGCKMCGFEKMSEKRINNPSVSWTLTSWENAANSSNNFDCYKIYIVELFDELSGEKFIKIGRTFTDTKSRMISVPYSFTVLKEWVFYNPDQAFDIENELKIQNNKFRYKPLKKFGGESECFSVDILYSTDILNNIGLSDLVGKILDFEYNKF